MTDFFNFNDAEEQHERGPIPEDSIVKVLLTVRKPTEEKVGSNPYLRKSNDGSCEMLDCEFTVQGGAFAGKKFWRMFLISGTTDKQLRAVDGTRSTLRAIIEAANGIFPEDTSAKANKARNVTGPSAFDGLIFPVKIGIIKPRPGDQYINNTIKKVITPDMKAYVAVMEKGKEHITTKPIPVIPDQPAQGFNDAAPFWGGNDNASSQTKGDFWGDEKKDDDGNKATEQTADKAGEKEKKPLKETSEGNKKKTPGKGKTKEKANPNVPDDGEEWNDDVPFE